MEVDTVLLGRILVYLGIPSLIGWFIRWFIRDRKRQRNHEEKEEKLIPYEVRGIAATAFETEITALRKSADLDRAIKDNTIRDLTAENLAKTEKIASQRVRIVELEGQVDSLTTKVRDLQSRLQTLLEELQTMSAKLAQARLDNERENDAFDSLHPGPGS